MKEQILTFLPQSHPWREQIHWFDTIGSTNTEAKAMGKAGAPHGTVLIADRQSGGRGRMGRSFHSAPGVGIYLSVILRPSCAPEQLMHLTCAVAVAMCDAIERFCGFRPGVKWINDLIANKRKLGGILTELSISPVNGMVDFAVVGVGINCCQDEQNFPPELREIAVSLQKLTGKPIDRSCLAAAMLVALHKMDTRLLTEKAAVMAQYKADCITLGQDIYLLRGDVRLPCHALELDADGGLLVEYPDGSVETVCSGEVSVRNL